MADVHHPLTLADALSIRARTGAVVFAGGTDLMVKRRTAAGALPDFPGAVLFLDRIGELSGITMSGGGLEIGAMTTLAEITRSSLVPDLRRVVLEMGGPALRSSATLGGNVCNASPAGDTLPFLYASDAVVVAASIEGDGRICERCIPIAHFITGPGATTLAAEEIVIAVRVPEAKPAVFHWRKVGTRKANALTKISLAAFAERDGDRVSRARIALGAVAPTVVRLAEVERMLEGSVRKDRLARAFEEEAREACRAAVHPIDDQRSSAEYRGVVAANLLIDFIRERI